MWRVFWVPRDAVRTGVRRRVLAGWEDLPAREEAVGVRAGGQASAALINLIYLPMSFLSGLWVPLQFFPHWLQELAKVFPAYHLGQIALGIVHQDGGDFLAHLIYLLIFTAVCLGFAQHGWRRIQDR